MILPNTPHELVLQVMRNEAHKVEFFIKKEGSKLLSALERTPYTLFPFLSYKIYTVPSSRNKYLVWFEVMDYRELKNGTFISGSCLIVNEEKGGITAYVQKISYDSEIKQHTSVLNIYTGHFFNRKVQLGKYQYLRAHSPLSQQEWQSYDVPGVQKNEP